MNIQEQVQNSLDQIVSSGKVEEMISAQVEKTIDSIIKDSLREYSDFGKTLKKAVESALEINLEQVSVLGYQQIVVDIVNEKLKAAVMEKIATPIESALSQIIAPFDKRTYKLSEIIEQYREKEYDSSDDDYVEISLHVEHSSYGTIHVAFDKSPNKERYECEYQLSIDKKESAIWSFEIKGWRPQRGDLRAQAIHGPFDHFIFNLYASKAPIELDERDVDTTWSRYDD